MRNHLRILCCAFLSLMLCAAMLSAANKSDVESFFSSTETLTLQVDRSVLSPNNVARFELPWGQSRIQIEVQVNEDMLAELPMQISVVPAQLEAFTGRSAEDVKAVARQDLAAVLTNPQSVPFCGNRKLVAQGPAQWSGRPQVSSVLFGFAMLQEEIGGVEPLPGGEPGGDEETLYSEECFADNAVEGGAPDANLAGCKIGHISPDCPLTPGINCFGPCSGLWFTGRCAPGRNIFGWRLCGCFP